MPLMGPMSDFAGVNRDIVVTAYQLGSGWINLFAPTAATVVAGLAIAMCIWALLQVGHALHCGRVCKLLRYFVYRCLGISTYDLKKRYYRLVMAFFMLEPLSFFLNLGFLWL